MFIRFLLGDQWGNKLKKGDGIKFVLKFIERLYTFYTVLSGLFLLILLCFTSVLIILNFTFGTSGSTVIWFLGKSPSPPGRETKITRGGHVKSFRPSI